MKKIFIPSSFLAIATPLFAEAQVTDISSFQALFLQIVIRLSYLAWVALFAFFVLGIVKFIYNANDSAEREKGKQYMVWAIICFVVIVSLWGIVRFILVDTLGIAIGGTPGFVTDP